MTVSVRMYCTAACPYCHMALAILEKKGVAVERIAVDQTPERRREMTEITGARTVPQIFIGETYIGGYRELSALERAGDLDHLLAGT